MKLKKITAFALAIATAASLMVSQFSASAAVVMNETGVDVLPGNTQSASPNYSMAWLDNVIIRDSTTAVTSADIAPKADYPYSRTYDEFINELDNYTKLNELNEQTVTESYMQTVEMLFYLVTALDMTDDLNVMIAYLNDKGIDIPLNLTGDDKMKVAIVYAAIKYNAVYVLYGKNVTITQGTTLDGAVVIILAELSAVKLPSGIDTLTGFALETMKTYVEGFDEIPMSQNPEGPEIFYWIKVIVAASNDYQVPLMDYDVTEDVYKTYVDYAYYASLLDTLYSIHIDPVRLAKADADTNPTAIAKLVLQTMLEEKKIEYKSTSSCETLFALACTNGYFQLEREFYSDIFNYDVFVSPSCDKLWFTPFGLADELDGDNANISIDLNGKKMTTSQTAYAELNKTNKSETVVMTVTYDDLINKSETVTYTFNVIKSGSSSIDVSNSNDLVSQIQSSISQVIPEDNEKVNSIMSGVAANVESFSLPDYSSVSNSVISTYPSNETTKSSSYQGEAQTVASGVDFSYLETLIGETYAVKDSTAVTDKDKQNAQNGEASVVSQAIETVKENPEIVVAPTGVIAVGGYIGYMLSKKKKKDDFFTESEETEDDN